MQQRQANWTRFGTARQQQVLNAPIPNTKDVIEQRVVTGKRFRTMAAERINIFLGRTGTGKTNLLRYCIKQGLMQRQPLWDRVVVLCPTAHASHDYDWLRKVDEKCVITDVSTRKLGAIVADCKERAATTQPWRTLIVMDDCLGVMKMTGNEGKIFQELAASCRHGHITVAILCQGLSVGCPPIIRSNAEVTYASYMGKNDMKYMEEMSPQGMERHQLYDIITQNCKAHKFVRFSKMAGEEMPIAMEVPRCEMGQITVTR